MAVPHPKGLDQQQVLALLALAERHIKADRLAAAAAHYRRVLSEPILDALPAARTEAQANFGALLLHAARIDPGGAEAHQQLEQAIELLGNARTGYQSGEGAGNAAVTSTNLALAYFERHRLAGDDADLMSAHVALDGAEAAAPDDPETRDWIRSVRDILLEHVDRRRTPR